MAWSNSKIFVAIINDALENTAAYDFNGDTFNVALYTTCTPDNTVSLANGTYGADQWVVGNEVSDAAEWAAGGQALDNTDMTVAAAVIKFDADDEISAGSSATLASVYGCHIYDATVANRGVCYNYFGGAQSVTNGTMTVVFNAAGIFTLTLT